MPLNSLTFSTLRIPASFAILSKLILKPVHFLVFLNHYMSLI